LEQPITVTLRQVVLPGKKLFKGSIRFRIMDDMGPFEVEREITEEVHTWHLKPLSKVQKQ
jgi:hypothetical protein